MTTLQERVGNERRRLRLVRLKMAAAIESKASGDESYVPFYVAAADYIDATMQRLHHQDVKMRDMLVEKLGESDDRLQAALGKLDDRLESAKAQLKPFLAARDELKEKGAAALAKFEETGKKYSDFIASNMGHDGGSTNLAAEVFKPEDWEYMAGITDEQQKLDADLFAQVEQTSPEPAKHVEA